MIIDKFGLLEVEAPDFIGKSVAVLGIKGSGKSNTAAVLMEELLKAGVPICVVDIAGEFYTLKDAFSQVAVIGSSFETEVDMPLSKNNCHEVAEQAYVNGASVVMDLSGITDQDSREELLFGYFRTVRRLALRHRIPYVIFLEEAHNWIPQSGKTAVKQLFVTIATEDRKRGLSLVMVGQRIARISKDTLTQADFSLLHRVMHPADMRVYREMLPWLPRDVKTRVMKLKNGEIYFVQGASVVKHTIRLRHTRHPGKTPGMENIPAVQASLLDLMGDQND